MTKKGININTNKLAAVVSAPDFGDRCWARRYDTAEICRHNGRLCIHEKGTAFFLDEDGNWGKTPGRTWERFIPLRSIKGLKKGRNINKLLKKAGYSRNAISGLNK